jgi:hypothetical protein
MTTDRYHTTEPRAPRSLGGSRDSFRRLAFCGMLVLLPRAFPFGACLSQTRRAPIFPRANWTVTGRRCPNGKRLAGLVAALPGPLHGAPARHLAPFPASSPEGHHERLPDPLGRRRRRHSPTPARLPAQGHHGRLQGGHQHLLRRSVAPRRRWSPLTGQGGLDASCRAAQLCPSAGPPERYAAGFEAGNELRIMEKPARPVAPVL